MSEFWRGTGLCRDTVLRINLLTDTKIDTKKFFQAFSKREQSLCSPWGTIYITRTGRGSIQMCYFMASQVLFLLPWMPFPYIIHLINYGSTFRVQLMDHQFCKTFLDFLILHRTGETLPPLIYLYYCTHQLLGSHLTGGKIKVQRSDQPRVTQLSHTPSTSSWYHSVLVNHTGPNHCINTLASLL